MMTVVEREALSELLKGARERQAKVLKQWLDSISPEA
ncbi:hypothetical protein M446_1480 [Methylobacterium sp. 4-46]|nr:hypothetical protein M446_1480 [Methylobacterium sp. 4-46]